MNVPNMITIFRIFLVPVFLLVFHSSMENRILYSGIIFLAAGASDVLDGYIARKQNLTSKLGAVLDPLADKLMSFAVLISFAMHKDIQLWILLVLIAKEICMILGAIALYFKKENHVIPSNRFGKNATVALYASIISIVLNAPTMMIDTLLIVTVVFNIMAFISYMKIFVKIR